MKLEGRQEADNAGRDTQRDFRQGGILADHHIGRQIDTTPGAQNKALFVQPLQMGGRQPACGQITRTNSAGLVHDLQNLLCSCLWGFHLGSFRNP